MKVKKGILGEVSLSDEKLREINRFSKKELKKEEVYAFSAVLCDNEVDRDFERFSISALHTLAELFIGKTGICDHSPKAENQVARIFATRVEELAGERTSTGEPYTRLIAEAYTPKGAKYDDFILGLEAGIHKEVSVGCGIGKKSCSICGADLQREICGHIKGESYREKGVIRQCYTLLEEPEDAYEWSFVAVPSQRRAGVLKGFMKGEEGMESEKIIKALGKGEITLSKSEGEELKKEFSRLLEIARELRLETEKSCIKSILKLFPNEKEEDIAEILKCLDFSALKATKKLFSKASEPIQLGAEEGTPKRQLGEFMI